MNDNPLNIEKNGKKVGEVYFFLEEPLEEQEKFVREIAAKIMFSPEIGFAGYKERKDLESFLKWMVYGAKRVERWVSIQSEECEKEIKDVFEVCSKVINENTIKIFIIPTVDQFVKEQMMGVSGFTPWKNTILLAVCKTKKFNDALRNTLCHELAHALSLHFHERKTISDDLVSEGIAEHFREAFLGGEKSKWVKSISEEKAKEIFLEIQGDLKTQNDRLYRELFFGAGKYPMWAGYAIGYYLVKSFLDGLDEIRWKDIIKTSPSTILNIAKNLIGAA